MRAQEGDRQQQQGQTDGDKESLLEALEAQARARKGAKSAQLEAQRPPAAQVSSGQSLLASVPLAVAVGLQGDLGSNMHTLPAANWTAAWSQGV